MIDKVFKRLNKFRLFLICKTFEGQESAVHRIEFLSRGMQIVSSGADGLIKLWSIKTAECNTTLDQHNDIVWSLACKF